MEDPVKNLEADISELKRLLEMSERSRVRDLLSIDLRKLESNLIDLRASVNNNESEEGDKKKQNEKKANKPYDVQIKTYSWDQSEKRVKVYLTSLSGLKSVPKESLQVVFGPQSVDVRVEGLNNKNHVFALRKLCKPIEENKSSFKVTDDTLYLYLAKNQEGEKWSHLTWAEAEGARKKESKMDDMGSKDNSDPSASIMNLMKKMYDEGDDEMKRTIAKAWTESRDKKGPAF